MHDFNASRRGFLKGTGALTIGLLVGPAQPVFAASAPSTFRPNALLRIEPDNTVRVVMPHTEVGQGAYTGLAQVIADELDADWQYVVPQHLESLDDAYQHPDWKVIATGASTSVSSQWTNFREAGASARAMLIAAAATHWGVPADSLTASDSMVIDAANDRRVSYGELTERAAELTPPDQVTLKTPDQFKLIGRSLKRLDGMNKSNGQVKYGMDLVLPDMLYASIAHCPVFGGKLKSFDASAAKAMPGVRQVVEIPTGVAVIADSFWQAKKAKDALEIVWDEGDFVNVSSEQLWEDYAELAGQPGPVFEQHGQVDFGAAVAEISGEIRFPYLAHAPMEPLNATAQMTGDSVEIWSGTQFQGIDAPTIAAVVGIPQENIQINTMWGGGSFGRRGPPDSDFMVEAVQIAKASGLPNPIKMMWQREDDIKGGWYRPMALHRFRVGTDSKGMPAHWEHTIVAKSIAEGTAMESSYFVDGFDLLSIDGLRHQNYNVPNLEFTLQSPKHPVTVCWMRGEAEFHTAPTLESIMNRLARAGNHDALDYRRALLKDTEYGRRMRDVLDKLETAADWRTPPADGVSRGLAVMPAFGSVCGFVVELKNVDKALHFHRVVAAMDCGLVVNPDGVKSQIYGSVAFALSTFFGQAITIENGQAAQSNFHDYAVARMDQVPDVEAYLVDSALDYPTGVGEVPVPSFIPALMEAIAVATGEEVTEFPLTMDGYTFA